MPRKKKAEVVENPEAETVVDTVEVTEPEVTSEKTVDGNIATVVRGSFTARTYTKEKHGDNFTELAKEYAENNGGEVVVR